jgi:hypothetical protein
MCGHTFDPVGHAACQACPIKKGCSLVCCPACGFETVDPAQSKLVQFATALFSGKNASKRTPQQKEF